MTSFARARCTPAGLAIALAACLSTPALAQRRPDEAPVSKQPTAAQSARGPAMAPPTAVIKVTGGNVVQVDSLAKFDGSGSTSVPAGHALKYQWDFGDGTTATGATVTHKYNTATEACERVNSGAPGQNASALVVKLVVTDGTTPSAAAAYRVRICSGKLNANYPGRQP